VTVIANDAADSFVRQLRGGYAFFLVHGPDEGLAHERTKAITDQLIAKEPASLRLTRLDGDAVAREPGAFRDEVYALSLFGEGRIFWIDAQSRDIWPALEPVFAAPPADCAIVVKAGAIKKGGAMRTAFETSKSAVSIECYPDRRDAIGALIDREVRAEGATIDTEARETLVELLGSDRQATRNELGKLTAYAHGRPRIELEDVAAIVSDAAPSRLDAIVNDALGGDRAAVSAAMVRIGDERGEIETLLYLVIARLTLLYRLRIEVDQGKPLDAALRSLGPRLPWGSQQAVLKQAGRHGSAWIAQEMSAVRAASAKIRLEPQLAPVLATRMLLAIASRSRRGAR
jgi:DNA polymerase III subunit delta